MSSAEAVRDSIDEIVMVAAERLRTQLVDSLLEANILGALVDIPPSPESAALMRMHYRWLRDSFRLEPLYEKGQSLDVPANRVAAFDMAGEVTASPDPIVKLNIIVPGWKRDGAVLKKPVARLASEANAPV